MWQHSFFWRQAINIFGDKRNKEAAEKLAKEQELQKIHVKKEDIEVIVSVEIDKTVCGICSIRAWTWHEVLLLLFSFDR